MTKKRSALLSEVASARGGAKCCPFEGARGDSIRHAVQPPQYLSGPAPPEPVVSSGHMTQCFPREDVDQPEADHRQQDEALQELSHDISAAIWRALSPRPG